MLERLGYSLAVLVVTFVIQKWLSFTSRSTNTASRWGREDYLLWPDWIASALITFFVLLLKGNNGDTIAAGEMWGLAFIVSTALFVPGIVRELAYDSTSPHALLTWQGIVVPNLFSSLTIGMAVGVGVDFSS